MSKNIIWHFTKQYILSTVLTESLKLENIQMQEKECPHMYEGGGEWSLKCAGGIKGRMGWTLGMEGRSSYWKPIFQHRWSVTGVFYILCLKHLLFTLRVLLPHVILKKQNKARILKLTLLSMLFRRWTLI